MTDIRSLEGGSHVRGPLPHGCIQCARGAKLVLLITGLCRNDCFYCPLSAEKKGRDCVYANEAVVETVADIVDEATRITAEGTGITGGDPLCVLQRTLDAIALLKNQFGPAHHIHLYTAMAPSRDDLQALAAAGLDELRFHVPAAFWARFDESPFAAAVDEAHARGMTVGVEIPSLPEKADAMCALADALEAHQVAFLNLNELEFSETNADALLDRGYDVVDDVSSAVAGSEEAALAVLAHAAGTMTVHFCSSGYKDSVQLTNRLKRRAGTIARPLDIITDEGTLLTGTIDGDEALCSAVKERFAIPDDLITYNYEKKRIDVAPWVLEDCAPLIDAPCYIIEVYPTADALEVERRPL